MSVIVAVMRYACRTGNQKVPSRIQGQDGGRRQAQVFYIQLRQSGRLENEAQYQAGRSRYTDGGSAAQACQAQTSCMQESDRINALPKEDPNTQR